jgi:hypothetical protein
MLTVHINISLAYLCLSQEYNRVHGLCCVTHHHRFFRLTSWRNHTTPPHSLTRRIVEDDGVTPYVLAPDPDPVEDTGFSVGVNGDTMNRTRNYLPDKSGRDRTPSTATTPQVRSLAPTDRLASDAQTANKSALGSTFSEYAYREAEGYVTVNQAMRACLRAMAIDGWRSQDERGDTVVHCVLQVRTSCEVGVGGRLSEWVDPASCCCCLFPHDLCRCHA